MSQRIPFSFDAEYRGREAEGGEFVNDTGESVSYGPAYKFEYDMPDGEPVVMALRTGALDKVATPDLNVAELKKGDRVQLVGEAVIPDRNAEGRGFVRLHSVARVDAKLRAAG